MARSDATTPDDYLAELPLDVIGETIARVDVDRYLTQYQALRGSSRLARRTERTV